MVNFDIGQAVPRTEDLALLRGRGRYVDDIVLPKQSYLYLLRSPYAAARILRIDTKEAAAMPGVLAVLTGQDVVDDGIGNHLPHALRKKADGSDCFLPPYRVIALDRVHHVGDIVAAVIAESVAQAKDAAEHIDVEYEGLPSVTNTAQTVEPGAAAVWDEVPDNISFTEHVGDEAAVKAAFAKAKHIVRAHLVINRLSIAPMEPRMASAVYDEREQRYTLYATLQMPHVARHTLATNILRVPMSKLRVISPDVGGGFGLKSTEFPEYAVALWAAKKLGRPVKWTGERSEAFASDHAARDNVSDVALALDENGKFLALDVDTIANLGAYLSFTGMHVPTNHLGNLAGTYTTPHIHVKVRGVFSNTNPTCAYRGAGRPEASLCIERIIDIAARDLGIDRIEIRRRNLIPANAMPFQTGLTFKYDCGEFEIVLDKALKLGNWEGAKQRQEAARKAGKLYGIGLCSVIEIAGGSPVSPPEEAAEIRFDDSGTASVFVGSHSHGQGHETAFRQVINRWLGLDPDKVNIVFGDTDKVFHGRGTYGSRSITIGGGAVVTAAEHIIEKGRKIAGHLLEAAPADIEFSNGRFTVSGTDKSIDISTVAKDSFNLGKMPRDIELGLGANAVYRPTGGTFPNGCHICEVEIDPETGVLKFVRYSVVDDVGIVVNPLLLHGQIHGGVIQGLGQALCENMVYDAESGQLLSGSFMDYAMPRASDMPSIVSDEHVVPTKLNPLGVKGAGEAGCVGALPTAMNAINDALAPLGIRQFDMPASPHRLWRVISEARAAKPQP